MTQPLNRLPLVGNHAIKCEMNAVSYVHTLSKHAAKLKHRFCFLSCGMNGKNLRSPKCIGKSSKMTEQLV